MYLIFKGDKLVARTPNLTDAEFYRSLGFIIFVQL